MLHKSFCPLRPELLVTSFRNINNAALRALSVSPMLVIVCWEMKLPWRGTAYLSLSRSLNCDSTLAWIGQEQALCRSLVGSLGK